MMNLYYRGYVIHEDIRAISYTVYDRRPNRSEMGNSGTAREAMQLVDRDIAHRLTAWRREQPPFTPIQPAVL
jgi:hypothetical protein